MRRAIVALVAAVAFMAGALNISGQVYQDRRHNSFFPFADDSLVSAYIPLYKYGREINGIARDISGNNNHMMITGSRPVSMQSPINLVSNGSMEAGAVDGATLLTNGNIETIGPELVTNGSMELGQDDGTELVVGGDCEATTGWSVYGAPPTFEASTTQKYAGTKSLHVISDAGYKGFWQTISRTIGRSYTISFWYYLSSGSIVVNAGDMFNGGEWSTVIGTWTLFSQTYVSPSTDASASFILASNGVASEFYIDQISIRETNLIINPGFETIGAELVTNGNMELDANWASVNTPATNERSVTQKHGGTYSRHLVDSAPTNYGGFAESSVPVAIGKTYRMTCWVYLVSGTIQIQDGWGNKWNDYTSANSGTWVQKTYFFTAEFNIVNPTFKNWSNSVAAEFYIDDVSIVEVLSGWTVFTDSVELSTTSHSGTYSMKITGAGAGYIHGPAAVTEGHYYRLGFWTRGDGTNVGSYCLYGNDFIGSTGYISTGVSGTTFTYIEKVVKVPAGITFMDVYFQPIGGYMMADDISIAECFPPTGWSAYGADPLTADRSTVQKKAGSYSVHVTAGGNNRGVSQQFTFPNVGDVYKISWWYYLVSGEIAPVIFNVVDYLGADTHRTTTGQWVYDEMYLTVTQPGVHFLLMKGWGAAEFYIDDVSVKEVLTGWTVLNTPTTFELATSPTPASGAYSMKLTANAAYEGASQPLALTPGSYYRVNASVYGDATNKVFPRVLEYGPELVTNGSMESGTADGANLITNPGFETIGAELVTNGGFDSVTTDWSNGNSNLASIVGGQAGNCLEITRTAGSTQVATQALTLVAGHTYWFTAYVKSGTSGDEEGYIRVNDGSTNFQVVSNTTGSWVKWEKFFTPVANNCTLTLAKNTATAGTMLFDSISVVEVLSGWTTLNSPTVFEVSTAQKVSGSYSAHMVVGAAWGGMITPISVTSGHYYRVNLQLKSSNGNAVYVTAQNSGHGANDYTCEYDGTGAWVPIEFVFKANVVAPSGFLQIQGSNGGEDIYVDDVSIAECFPPTGWTAINTPEAIDRSTVRTHSLHVVDSTASWGGVQSSAAFVAGKMYRISYWYYIVSGQFTISSNASEAGGSKNNGVGSAWTYSEFSFLAGTSDGIVIENTSGTNPAEFYIDDVSVREVYPHYSPLAVNSVGYVYPASWTSEEWVFKATLSTAQIEFQSGSAMTAATWYVDDVTVAQAYVPTGWSVINNPVSADRSSIRLHEGSYSIHVNDSSPGESGGVQSASYSLTAGKQYKVSFWYYKVSGSLWLLVYDGNGSTQLVNDNNFSASAWTYRDSVVTAGNTGTGAYIIFANNSAVNPAEFYIDDVKLEEVVGWDNVGWNLDGIDDRGVINHYAALDVGTGDFTIGGWFKPMAGSQHGRFLMDYGTGNMAGGYGLEIGQWVNSDFTNKPYLVIDSAGMFGIGANAESGMDEWVCLVGTRRGGTGYLYVNGIQQTATGAWTGLNVNNINTSNLSIGYAEEDGIYIPETVGEIFHSTKGFTAQEIKNYCERTSFRYPQKRMP